MANKRIPELDPVVTAAQTDKFIVRQSGDVEDKHADMSVMQLALQITESQITDLQSYLLVEANDLTAAVVWADIPDANVPESAVTQHVAAIDHDQLLNFVAGEHFTQAAISITESQVSDLQAYLLDITGESLADLSDVAQVTPTQFHALARNALNTGWESRLLVEADISDLQAYLTSFTEVNDLSAAVTWANIPDVNVPESAVTQHQAALSITESQISDLQAYLLAEANDLSAAVVWANIPDANVPESAVTQHQAALSITESQISDLSHTIGVSGLGIWKYRTETTAPPATGQIRFNNADVSLATEFYLAETNEGGVDVSTFLELLLQDGSALYIQDQTDAANFLLIEISSSTDNGTYRTFGIQNIVEEGTEPGQNDDVVLITTGIASAGGLGDVFKVGTPANNQLAVWTGDGTLEGDLNWQVIGTSFQGVLGNGPEMVNAAGVNIRPRKGDPDTGLQNLGDDRLGLMAGNVAGIKLIEASGAVFQVLNANVGITAFAGGGVASATQLNSSYSVVDTVASPGDSVKFSTTLEVGLLNYVKNDGANALDLFPAAGDDLGLGVGVAISVPAGASVAFIGTVTGSASTQFIFETAVEVNDLTAAVTWANIPDVNVPASAVTQHVASIDHDQLLNFAANEHFTQAAISITESQISDLGAYLENVVEDTTPQLGGNLDTDGNNIVNNHATVVGLAITAGTNAAADGGDLGLTAGDSGVGATGDGGAVNIEAGASVATAGDGGGVSIKSGAGFFTGAGGDILVEVGAGGAAGPGTSGNLFVNTTVGLTADAGLQVPLPGLVAIYGVGRSGEGVAGNLELWGGYAAGTGGASRGGDLLLFGGGQGGGAGVGGDAKLYGGESDTTPGNAEVEGGVATVAGDGGDAIVAGGVGFGTNQSGGRADIQGGNGVGTGNGGEVFISGGDGGAGATSFGGNVTLKGGAPASTNGTGGNIILEGGDQTGSGVVGAIIIQNAEFNTATEMRFLEVTGAGGNYVGLVAPDTIASDFVLSLPNSDSTGTQALVSNGSGILSWSDILASDVAETLTNTWGWVDNTGIQFGTGDDWSFLFNGADLQLLCTPTTSAFSIFQGANIKWELDHDTDRMWLHDGYAFRISSSDDTDFADFSHDLTDFNTAFTTTADWNITGLSGRILQGAETLAFVSELPAAAVSIEAVQARRSTSLTLTTSYVDVTLNLTDVETDAAVVEHDNVNTDDIDVKATGLYEITYEVDIETVDVAGEHTITCDGRVRVNDTTVVNGSDARAGSINDGSLAGSIFPNHLSNTFLVELTASDFVTLQLRKTEVGGSDAFTAERISFQVKRLN